MVVWVESVCNLYGVSAQNVFMFLTEDMCTYYIFVI